MRKRQGLAAERHSYAAGLPVWQQATLVRADGPFLAWEASDAQWWRQRPMPIAALIHMALLAGPGLMPPDELQARVEAFAGKSALVDPRLLLPACARPDLAMAAGGRSVMVRCVSPEWRVFVPVGEGGAVGPTPAVVPAAAVAPAGTEVGLPRQVPAVRRGDQVTLEIGGDGFVIGMAAIADADSRDGRVALRAVAGGRRLYGVVGDDGRIRLRGLNTMVNGR